MRTSASPARGAGVGVSMTDRLPTPGAVLTSARIPSFLRDRQRERGDAVIGGRRVEETSPRRRDDHVLTAVAAKIRARRRMRGGAKLHRPEFPAGLCVEGAEAAVVGRANEHETAGSGDRSTVAR